MGSQLLKGIPMQAVHRLNGDGLSSKSFSRICPFSLRYSRSLPKGNL